MRGSIRVRTRDGSVGMEDGLLFRGRQERRLGRATGDPCLACVRSRTANNNMDSRAAPNGRQWGGEGEWSQVGLIGEPLAGIPPAQPGTSSYRRAAAMRARRRRRRRGKGSSMQRAKTKARLDQAEAAVDPFGSCGGEPPGPSYCVGVYCVGR